uniref:Uncharacterized protein n=1 Tax=Chrysotila carterae TaxID=13221 RepID=A0A7S4BGV2_CHRCT
MFKAARCFLQVLHVFALLLAVGLLSGNSVTYRWEVTLTLCVLIVMITIITFSIDLAEYLQIRRRRAIELRMAQELQLYQVQANDLDRALTEINTSSPTFGQSMTYKHVVSKRRVRRLSFAGGSMANRPGSPQHGRTANGTGLSLSMYGMPPQPSSLESPSTVRATLPAVVAAVTAAESRHASEMASRHAADSVRYASGRSASSSRNLPSVKQIIKRVVSVPEETFEWAADETLQSPPMMVVADDEDKGKCGTQALRRYMDVALARSRLPLAHRQKLVRQMAMRIRSPNYYLRQFHADCTQAFPELSLYAAASTSTSGRSSDEEYKRTIGALFSLYWLYRLDLQSVPGSAGFDGQRGFCFGVDDTWSPPSVHVVSELLSMHAKGASEPGHASARLVQLTPWQKRLFFYEATDWNALHQLMVDAQLLTVDASGRAEVNVDRTAAMLSLTAFHDIMKVEVLLPTTEGEYHGYSEGQRLLDHDLALGYVLDTDADALPAFASLAPAEQSLVRFTQAELGFNHGWLVQAEAPPGALFGNFRQLIEAEGISSADIAFYFLHWVTDLAGAIPAPLHGYKGCEKFVLKFPQSVLASFIRSFPFLPKLADTPPVELFESFLVEWWPTVLGPVPHGPGAIALMRLVIQAQNAEDQAMLQAQWRVLPEEHKSTLSREMALTGAADTYSISAQSGGPAFLVYYSPAFLRACLQERPNAALPILSEVYAAGRDLFPLSAKASCMSVTLFIDKLKSCTADRIAAAHAEGYCWLLVKHNSHEAVVEQHPLDALPQLLLERGSECRLLRLWSTNWPPVASPEAVDCHEDNLYLHPPFRDAAPSRPRSRAESPFTNKQRAATVWNLPVQSRASDRV